MATAYDTWLTDAPEPVEIDDAALAALTSHPVMIEEAMTNQDGAYWAKLAKLMNDGDANATISFINESVSSYVKETVTDRAEFDCISFNHAIDRILTECNRVR